jgi:hypothetical protein
MVPKKTDKRGTFQYLLFATPKPSPARPARDPVVVVVRSRHEESAVWRVLPNAGDATDTADPPPVVRLVIPIDINATD